MGQFGVVTELTHNTEERHRHTIGMVFAICMGAICACRKYLVYKCKSIDNTLS